ncbi:MAG TPA: nickel pincer cofactor biosynthesis protein LarB [Vicinamibacterales bacterium]|nr:nickel pincer cofactor biosynthesis protein LarB [Vicinamibacterales bacterium]
MTPAELRVLLDAVSEQRIEPDLAHRQLLAAMRDQPFEDLGFARVDHHRSVRQGFPEVILGIGKTPDQIATIAARIVARGQPLLVTRADELVWRRLQQSIPEAIYHELARAITVRRDMPRGKGTIVIASAGTSDLSVAEEAAVTADLMGNDLDRVYDIGVAGIHRMLSARDRLSAARVIIVVAGMEGALPSVVAGMVDVPVIAVPTSVGYGASFGGVAALLGMLNSCANGVSVVNIDNGFGAGCIASMINHL